jgi:poly-gamma-glutamate biosynthesis protein PgsC/CapC
MLPEAIGIGLVVILAFGELFGLTAGGMVVPGYLATQLDKPFQVVATLVIAGLVFLGTRGAGRVTLLYGRRRFVLTILLGFTLGLLAEHVLEFELGAGEARSIGFILPGLIAHTMESQGVVVTLGALVTVTLCTRFILIAAFGASLPF